MKKILLFGLILLVISCNSKIDFDIKEVQIAGLVDSVSIVSTGNLSANSLDELIIGKDSMVYIYSFEGDSAILQTSITLRDQVLLLQSGDVDSDGQSELLVATGHIRYKETDVRIFLIENSDGNWTSEQIFSKNSIRPQATDLSIADYPNPQNTSIIISYFESKYMVETVVLNLVGSQWIADTLGLERMAMTRDVGVWPDDTNDKNRTMMAVGRVYGDEIGMVGDAYFLNPRLNIPSKRGVKVIKFGDGDNDGKNELYLGDGWHQDYGKIARGRIAQVKNINSELSYELIEDVKYQYEITQIEIEDINKDGLNEVLGRGNKYLRIYKKMDDSWTVFSDSIIPARQFAIGNIIGNKHPELIFSGPRVKIFNLGNIEFTSELGEEVSTKPISPDSLIGKPAPELSMMAWLNGSFPGLYNSKGKVILLDFWATWCKPCIKTFSEMERFQKTYGPEGLQILGLTRIDNRQDIEAIKDYTSRQDFLYPIGIGNESLNNLVYGVGGIPHVVLIDKKGIVRWYKVGAGNTREMEEKIKSLLAE